MPILLPPTWCVSAVIHCQTGVAHALIYWWAGLPQLAGRMDHRFANVGYGVDIGFHKGVNKGGYKEVAAIYIYYIRIIYIFYIIYIYIYIIYTYYIYILGKTRSLDVVEFLWILGSKVMAFMADGEKGTVFFPENQSDERTPAFRSWGLKLLILYIYIYYIYHWNFPSMTLTITNWCRTGCCMGLSANGW